VTARTHSDADRAEWIYTTLEGLYHDQQRSRLSMRDFIRANRSEIDEQIDAILNRPPAGHGPSSFTV
jgi:hypothetical protein